MKQVNKILKTKEKNIYILKNNRENKKNGTCSQAATERVGASIEEKIHARFKPAFISYLMD